MLRALRAEGPSQLGVWFVEDRFKALEAIATQRDLDDVRLFLAAWGYNFEPERATARRGGRITLLSLEDFTRDFSAWPS